MSTSYQRTARYQIWRNTTVSLTTASLQRTAEAAWSIMSRPGPAADGREVRLIPIGAVARHAEDIDRVLARLQGDPSYRFRMVRARIRPGQADRLDQRFMPGAREHDHIPGAKAARQDLLLHGAGRYRLAWHSPVASARPAGVRLACTGSGSWMRQAGTGSVCGPGQVASPGCR